MFGLQVKCVATAATATVHPDAVPTVCCGRRACHKRHEHQGHGVGCDLQVALHAGVRGGTTATLEA